MGVDDATLRGGRAGVERSHGNNVIALEDHSLIGQFFSRGDIDDDDVSDRGRVPGRIFDGLQRGCKHHQQDSGKNRAQGHPGLETQRDGIVLQERQEKERAQVVWRTERKAAGVMPVILRKERVKWL